MKKAHKKMSRKRAAMRSPSDARKSPKYMRHNRENADGLMAAPRHETFEVEGATVDLDFAPAKVDDSEDF